MKKRVQNTIRKDSLYRFRFGLDAMKALTVCPNCNSLQNSNRIICSNCQGKLTKATLYDLYKSHHKSCQKCGTVVSANMQFCPHCGQSIIDHRMPYEFFNKGGK